MKFPKVDAALAAGDKCQWQIGDALLDEIPIGSAGESNDSQALLEECAEEQERRGRIISWRTLKEYRSVANAFPKEARGSFSWTACRQAGSPEMLRAVQKITGKKLPTTREVDRTRPVVEHFDDMPRGTTPSIGARSPSARFAHGGSTKPSAARWTVQ